jgi:hypothetical protein
VEHDIGDDGEGEGIAWVGVSPKAESGKRKAEGRERKAESRRYGASNDENQKE